MAEHAGKAKIMLAVEYLNRFECYLMNTAAETARYVREVEHPNFRMMYDTFHANIEEKNIADSIRVCRKETIHIHISENDRGVPGTGHVDWNATFDTLKETGYDGWLTIEAFGWAFPEIAAATKIWRKLFADELRLGPRRAGVHESASVRKARDEIVARYGNKPRRREASWRQSPRNRKQTTWDWRRSASRRSRTDCRSTGSALPLPRCCRPATIPISRPKSIRPRWIWRPTSPRLAADGGPAEQCELTPSTILEAMLFVGAPGNVPLTSQQVARLMRGVRPTEIDALVRQLNATYAARNCPYEIAAEGPGYRMRLRDEHARLRDRFYGKARQPGSRRPRSRFWPSWPTTSRSPRRRSAPGAAPPAGRSSANWSAGSCFASSGPDQGSGPGRYRTTDRFLELFSLESLDDLPRSPDAERRLKTQAPLVLGLASVEHVSRACASGGDCRCRPVCQPCGLGPATRLQRSSGISAFFLTRLLSTASRLQLTVARRRRSWGVC